MLNEISITKGVREAHLFDYDASGQISAKIRYYVAVAQRPKFKQNYTKMPLFR